MPLQTHNNKVLEIWFKGRYGRNGSSRCKGGRKKLKYNIMATGGASGYLRLILLRIM
jgi:hypothetical protein